MKDKVKLKQKIAIEILLFFSAIVLVSIVWVFLLLRNYYYNHEEKSLTGNLNSLKTQIDSLPPDKTKEIYNYLNQNFYVGYKVGKESFDIPVKSEKLFLTHYPKAEKLSIYPKGFSYFKINSIAIDNDTIKYFDKEELGKKIKNKYPEYSDMTDEELAQSIFKKYPPRPDSILIFDFVELEKFREFIKNKDYRNKLYITFFLEEKNSIKIYLVAGELVDVEEKDVIAFLRNYPKAIYPKSFIAGGDTYNYKEIEILKENLNNKKELTEMTLKNNKTSVWNKKDIWRFLLRVSLFVGIILYPLRLIYFLIRWAIKTVKHYEKL